MSEELEVVLGGGGGGAWGDNIVIADLCNMFNITINVLSVTSQYSNTVAMTPMSSVSHNEINSGNVMQYHFVAVGKSIAIFSVDTNEMCDDICSQQTETNSESVV